MKRFVAYILAAMVVLSLGAGVIAEEKTQGINLTYSIDENSYVIDMPADLTLTDDANGCKFTVELSNIHATGISCYITSLNGMKLVNNKGDNSLSYSISPCPDASSPITLTNVYNNKEFTVTITEDTKFSVGGNYTDILTFHFTPFI